LRRLKKEIVEKMDFQTLKYYSENITELSKRYNSADGGICNYFHQAFIKGNKIIDIGCGSARDVNQLIELGYDAYGIDACEEWIDDIAASYPSLKGKVCYDSLPDLKTINDHEYDGILCSAVLMHIPKEELFDCAFNLKRILKSNGKMLLSIPNKTDDVNCNRDKNNRLFNGLTSGNLQLIFERLGFNLVSKWENKDSLGRDERNWSVMLFQLSNANGSRPIDTIESILNRDNKVATYKLALFRALADIALTNYNLAQWQFDGKVKIPIESIASKWIEYYWPILESDKRIPQTTGRQIAFRPQLEEFIDSYKGTSGSLARFCIEHRDNNFSDHNRELYQKLLSKLKTTIWNQPVRYAGGGSDFSILQYDKQDKTIIISADIWRELSLTGTWIIDAIILRWAELTSKISHSKIKTSEVIDLLLISPLPGREVSFARHTYDKLPNKECVWSGRTIKDAYVVDHAIPFALWHNNDLWNLLPSNTQVNGNKKDKLPTRRLVKARKDSIIHYWAILRDENQNRFNSEGFCGAFNHDAENWENKLFHCFSEAVEIAAIQRGVERWEP